MKKENGLAELRRGMGFTQKELAEQIGISLRTIHRYECGATSISIISLKAIAKVFNMTMDDLYDQIYEEQHG